MQNPERDSVINDLRTLVDFPTVSIEHSVVAPPEEQLWPFKEAVAYLGSRAIDEGLKRGKPFHVTELPSRGRPNLIIATHETKAPDLAFLVHLDTVPPHTPFELDDDGDTARGRGTHDMKYAAAACLALLADLPKGEDDISVSFMFTSDEEVGSPDGAQFLFSEGYRPKFLIVPDGDSSNPWSISQTCKGLWHFRIVDVPGQSGHGARPWLGQNAVRKARDFDAKLHAVYPDPLKPDQHALTLNLADMGVPRDIARAHNNIPGTAYMMYDARFPNQASMDEFKTTLEELMAEHLPGARVETDVLYDFYEADLRHPDVKLYSRLVTKAIGRPPKLVSTYGNTDAVHIHGIPSLITIPEGGNAHSNGEHVSIDGTMTFISIMKKLIAEKNRRHHRAQRQAQPAETTVKI